MTQTDILLLHFQQVGGITAAEAMSRYGIGRLAARVADLRREGYKVISETVSGKNRYGRPVRYARYSLCKK